MNQAVLSKIPLPVSVYMKRIITLKCNLTRFTAALSERKKTEKNVAKMSLKIANRA